VRIFDGIRVASGQAGKEGIKQGGMGVGRDVLISGMASCAGGAEFLH
jgi:hypothetical protein